MTYKIYIVLLTLSFSHTSSLLAEASTKETRESRPKQVEKAKEPVKDQKAVPKKRESRPRRQDKEKKLTLNELKSIQEKLQNFKFLNLDFEQTVYKKMRNKTFKTRGEASFRKKPASFHWKFKDDIKEEWIYDGETLYHYFPEKNYAQRYKSGAAKGKNLREVVDMVVNFESLLKRYRVDSATQKKELVTAELFPKKKEEITRLVLKLDLEKKFIRGVKMEFDGGNYSVFVFSNPQRKQRKGDFALSHKVKITDP